MSFSLSSSFDDVFDTEFDSGDYDNISYEDNIFGGDNIYDDGVYVGHSEANIFGGKDYYDDDNQQMIHTASNGIGGLNVYSDEGYEGTLVESSNGDDIFYGADGTIEHLDFTDCGNGSMILQFDDPLAHISSYVMPDLIL